MRAIRSRFHAGRRWCSAVLTPHGGTAQRLFSVYARRIRARGRRRPRQRRRAQRERCIDVRSASRFVQTSSDFTASPSAASGSFGLGEFFEAGVGVGYYQRDACQRLHRLRRHRTAARSTRTCSCASCRSRRRCASSRSAARRRSSRTSAAASASISWHYSESGRVRRLRRDSAIFRARSSAAAPRSGRSSSAACACRSATAFSSAARCAIRTAEADLPPSWTSPAPSSISAGQVPVHSRRQVLALGMGMQDWDQASSSADFPSIPQLYRSCRARPAALAHAP